MLKYHKNVLIKFFKNKSIKYMLHKKNLQNTSLTKIEFEFKSKK
jgi:hypothetical protein